MSCLCIAGGRGIGLGLSGESFGSTNPGGGLLLVRGSWFVYFLLPEVVLVGSGLVVCAPGLWDLIGASGRSSLSTLKRK